MLPQKVRDLLASPIKEMQALGKVLKEEEDTKTAMGLHLVREIQTLHPEVIISGSLALYLHGIRLNRYKKNGQLSDIDLIVPYYISFEKSLNLTGYYSSENSSDFDYIVEEMSPYKGKKIDVKIDNKQPYEMIEMDDFKFKVSLIEDIIAAKIRYMKQGRNGEKHKNDLYEMWGKLTIIPEVEYAHNGS